MEIEEEEKQTVSNSGGSSRSRQKDGKEYEKGNGNGRKQKAKGKGKEREREREKDKGEAAVEKKPENYFFRHKFKKNIDEYYHDMGQYQFKNTNILPHDSPHPSTKFPNIHVPNKNILLQNTPHQNKVVSLFFHSFF